MSAGETSPAPTWIERLPPRPLCDVPWLGRSVILSDGSINFCCFSDAVIGNVNAAPLEQAWSGEAMQRIRRELTQQRFPEECKTPSCPIFRGDRETYLLERMDGVRRDVTPQRLALAATRIELDAAAWPAGEWSARLRVDCAGPPLVADLFVGVTFPDGQIRFLPDLAEFPCPLARAVELCAGTAPTGLPLLQDRIDASIPAGPFELCAALFLQDASPNVAANCLWSARCRFVLAAPDETARRSSS